MLNRLAWPRSIDPHVSTSHEPTIDLVEIFRLLRRQRLAVFGVFVLAISGALIYLAATPSRYTASTMLMFDVRNVEPLQQQALTSAEANSAYVDSQVEVLKSDAIARSVITKLDLLSDPEFTSPPSGLSIAWLLNSVLDAVLGADGASRETDQLSRAVSLFRSNLTIKRTGLTYIVDVAYRSLYPSKAAKIANSIAEAYIVGQLESKYDAARRANRWLQERIDELKAHAERSERAVAEYRTTNNIADSNVRPLTDQELAQLSGQRRVTLRDLESSAQTYRSLHETFVQRAAQMQSFPTTEARVVSTASPPLDKSDPKTVLVLGAASLLGLVGGLAFAFAREQLSTVLRSPSDLEREAGIICLGVLPTVPWIRSNKESRRRDANHNPSRDAGSHGASSDRAGRRFISRDPARYTCVIDRPLSPCTEAIQFLAADIAGLGRRSRVIGVSSALPREGKSMVAANLSELIAQSGHKVLLIDCNLRNCELTRQLAPLATQGLMDAVANRAPVNDLVWRDPGTGLDFLPSPRPLGGTDPPGCTLSSATMQKLIETLQECYEHVILDLPPIIPVADVKSAARLIESFILVIEWGRTSKAAVVDALNTAPLVSERLLGAVLNKAKPAVLKQLSYRGRYLGG